MTDLEVFGQTVVEYVNRICQQTNISFELTSWYRSICLDRKNTMCTKVIAPR